MSKPCGTTTSSQPSSRAALALPASARPHTVLSWGTSVVGFSHFSHLEGSGTWRLEKRLGHGEARQLGWACSQLTAHSSSPLREEQTLRHAHGQPAPTCLCCWHSRNVPIVPNRSFPWMCPPALTAIEVLTPLHTSPSLLPSQQPIRQQRGWELRPAGWSLTSSGTCCPSPHS